MGDSAATSGVPGGGKGAAASGLSIGAAGLKAYGDIEASQGTAAAYDFKSRMLAENARRGRAAAVETGADLSTRLQMTLGNIDAMQAASRTDPTSPNAAAQRDTMEDRGLAQKSIAVDQIMAQSKQEEDEAGYLQYAAKSALKMGKISAGVDIASALAKALV